MGRNSRIQDLPEEIPLPVLANSEDDLPALTNDYSPKPYSVRIMTNVGLFDRKQTAGEFLLCYLFKRSISHISCGVCTQMMEQLSKLQCLNDDTAGDLLEDDEVDKERKGDLPKGKEY